MYIVASRSSFMDAFKSIRPDNFTYEALDALYDHFEDTDSTMILDVVAICCDWAEYSSAEEAAQEFGWERPSVFDADNDDDDDAEASAIEWLTDKCHTYIRLDNGSVVVCSA